MLNTEYIVVGRGAHYINDIKPKMKEIYEMENLGPSTVSYFVQKRGFSPEIEQYLHPGDKVQVTFEAPWRWWFTLGPEKPGVASTIRIVGGI